MIRFAAMAGKLLDLLSWIAFMLMVRLVDTCFADAGLRVIYSSWYLGGQALLGPRLLPRVCFLCRACYGSTPLLFGLYDMLYWPLGVSPIEHPTHTYMQ